MPAKIPFNLSAANSALVPLKSGPVKVSLPIGGLLKPPPEVSLGSLATSRQQQIIMAVAVAAGMWDPTESVKTAKLVDKEPEKLICPKIDDDKINRILRAVGSVLDNPTSAPSANEKITDTANAVGASPVLVAAAFGAIEAGADKAEKDALASNALKWAASLEAKFLGRSAQAAARVVQLARIADPAARLDVVEKDVAVLDKRVTKLESTAGGGAPD